MPIYVYECDTCKMVFEIEQRITEEPLTKCECGKGKVKRIIQPVGVAFKGSGFYINDSAKPSADSTSSDS
ncbi:MAG: zinc ribbon domain-containing protein [Fimbriimonadaceae bacterium]|nr:zinc ribbon domain-containing protein [Fimbriimonadaceae bacterium]